jgi:hypothetical protein
VQGESDKFLYVFSHAKALKEASMNERFSQRFEEELKNLESGLVKKRGTKTIGKVSERLGRIKERYPSANKHYKIGVVSDGTFATAVNWKRIETSPESTDGVYFLRTSKTELSETGFWNIHNTPTQIEETFRILKTDLSLRPGFHRSDIQSEAHIYLGVVAFMVVMTIRHQLKASDIHHDWRNIVRLMNTQKMVLSSAKDSTGQLQSGNPCSHAFCGLHRTRPFCKPEAILPNGGEKALLTRAAQRFPLAAASIFYCLRDALFFAHRFRIACEEIKEKRSGIHAGQPYLAVSHMAIIGEGQC